MRSDNDNSAAPETSRLLPILGRVRPDGRIALVRPLVVPVIAIEAARPASPAPPGDAHIEPPV